MTGIDMYSTDKHGLRIDYAHKPPRFSVQDQTDFDRGIDYLNEQGYAVFKDVMSEHEVQEHKTRLWEFLEGIPHLHIQRNDPNTWHKWPGKSSYGVINDSGIGQSDFMWGVRSNRNIKRIFARIWNTRELLVSFDGCGVFRDWRYDRSWKTQGGWYHVDQNPVTKPDRCCIQGFAALSDQTENTGGLVVYPRTHLRFNELKPIARSTGDFVPVPGDHSVMDDGRAVGILGQCQAGDFIVWDSRLIHCNTPACVESEPMDKTPTDLLRVVAYISMSPATFVRDQTLDQFRKKRKQMLEENCTLNHWSTELRVASTNRFLAKVSLKKLDSYQRGLVVGLDFGDDDDTDDNLVH